MHQVEEEQKDKKVKKAVPNKKEKEANKEGRETESRNKSKNLHKIQNNKLTIVNETGVEVTKNNTIDINNVDETKENNSEKSSSSMPTTQKLAKVN